MAIIVKELLSILNHIKYGAARETRTSYPRFRKSMLYPTELRAPFKPLSTSVSFITLKIYLNTLFILLRTSIVLVCNKLPK